MGAEEGDGSRGERRRRAGRRGAAVGEAATGARGCGGGEAARGSPRRRRSEGAGELAERERGGGRKEEMSCYRKIIKYLVVWYREKI